MRTGGRLIMLHIANSIEFGEVRKDPAASKSCENANADHIRNVHVGHKESETNYAAKVLS